MELSERDPRIGSVVEGRYRILEGMAAGSMGVVYRAERMPVGKAVAIKFLHAAFASEPEFLSRFERETAVMSKLAHPHCVSVVDFGVVEGAPYLVMDYVSGTTLRELLDEAPVMATARALGLIRQILAGLAHAHEQGIVHRDIKPANLMITDEIGTGEHVRILDFGLARLRGAFGVNATQSHVVVGTPSYMAPEQTVDAAVDARADLYAVGVVLFEMIAGDKPFRAESTLELLGMHRGAPIPRLAQVAPPTALVPEGLQAVLDRALAKEVEDRFQTAIEFAAAIDEVIARMSMPPAGRAASLPPLRAPTLRTRTRRGIGLFGFAVLLVVGTATAAIWYVERGAPAAARHPAIGPPALADEAVAADAGVLAACAPADADGATAARPEIEPVLIIDDGEDDDGEDDDGEDDAEPDPTTAEDPNPLGDEGDDDEAADAPVQVADDKPSAPAPPRLARTVRGAVKMIQAGKREQAIASLRALWKEKPASAYIPFLLGNLYFDKRWWSVALDHYRAAIKKNAAYKKNGTLNRNVVRMLASDKTAGKARAFLRTQVGRPARPHLQHAAKHDKNPTVRKRSAALLKAIKR
jgi:eukaryotic-like serine/threonine-protein kinase